MKPHTHVPTLKLASNLRLYAILFSKGAGCLNQFFQIAKDTSEEAKLEAMWPTMMSSTVLSLFSLELSMKSVYSFVSTEPFKKTHNLRRLFDSLEKELSNELVEWIQARYDLSRDTIVQVFDKHANKFEIVRYPDTGDWVIPAVDMKVLSTLVQSFVSLAQELDKQSGVMDMLQADQGQVTQVEIQNIMAQMLSLLSDDNKTRK